jgi:hypothetical protein
MLNIPHLASVVTERRSMPLIFATISTLPADRTGIESSDAGTTGPWRRHASSSSAICRCRAAVQRGQSSTGATPVEIFPSRCDDQ